MKNFLNFYPYYEEALTSLKKTTTLRVGEPNRYVTGEQLDLTVGWDENSVKILHKIEIIKSYQKSVRDLNDSDLEGESADCKSPEAARQVLSCVYRKVINWEDVITIVKFKHL